MTDPSLAHALADHHNRSWQMAIAAMQNITAARWHDGPSSRLVPARIVYHLLMGGERYTWSASQQQFKEERRYSRDWEQATLDQLLTHGDALAALEAMQQHTQRWHTNLSDEGLLQTPPVWPWCGANMLGQSLYLLRHTQYHVSDLNEILRRHNLPPAQWQ